MEDTNKTTRTKRIDGELIFIRNGAEYMSRLGRTQRYQFWEEKIPRVDNRAVSLYCFNKVSPVVLLVRRQFLLARHLANAYEPKFIRAPPDTFGEYEWDY